MIREALELLVGLKRPTLVPPGDSILYSDTRLCLPPAEPLPEELMLGTLRGLLDLADTLGDPELLVHVHNPKSVRLLGPIRGRHRLREAYARACPDLEPFPWGRYYEREDMMIRLQAQFVPTEDLHNLLAFVGRIRAGEVREVEDDGTAQEVTVQRGIASLARERVTNPIRLRPRRTFPEIEQPESAFVIRLRELEKAPALALFEADGGAWAVEASERIHTWLATETPELRIVR